MKIFIEIKIFIIYCYILLACNKKVNKPHKRILDENPELKGSYLSDGVYYKCMDNCDECENDYECINCNSEYITINKNCFIKIQNCEDYDDNGNCNRCILGYKVGGSGDICEEENVGCEDFNNIQSICNKCIDGYRKSNINSLCYIDVQNCLNYGQNEICQKCDEGYAFLEEIRTVCKNKTEFEEYYTKDNGISYYKCDNLIKNGINKCKKCEYNYNDNEIICNECQSDYILKDDETNLCYLKSNFNYKKYYKIDEYHIKTCSKKINNCDECEKINDNENPNEYVINCKKCENKFRLSNKACYKIVDNCKTYGEDETCQKCFMGFAFEKDNREICKSTIFFDEYYSKDEGISYYKCDDLNNGGIENCRKCEYNNNRLICIECKNDYILKDEENNICYSNSTYTNDRHYYYEDSYHVKSCSLNIDNCVECEKSGEILNCNICQNNYYIVHDINKYCKKSNEITPANEYYLDEEKNEYYSCQIFNSVENCLECQNKEECDLCKENYAFIDDEKSICKNISDLGKHFFMDEIDSTIYRKCSEYVQNCDECTSKDECLTCIEKYGLYNDKLTCVNISEKLHFQNKEDNLYYLCDTEIDNCEKCSDYNICNKCKDGYIKVDNNKLNCTPITEINRDEYYIDPYDNNNYIKCTSYIKDCYSCQFPSGCNICKDGFIMLNDNKMFCNEINKTDLTDFYTNDNITYYSCKETKYKNDIHCFSLIPQQNIILNFLQAQIVRNKLVCYMITHSPIPKNFSLKLKINIYNSKTLRNLEEKEIILITNEYSNGDVNKIISFTSDEEYSERKNIQIKNIEFNNDDSLTSTVTNNNNCSLKFDSNSDLVDTGKVNSMILAKTLPDCSTGQIYNIINLSMNTIVNCEFNLYSEESISFKNDTLYINLVELENSENIITAKCDINSTKIKSIKCIINKDDKDEINNEYLLKEQILFESDKFIIITPEEKQFKILCEKKKSTNMTIVIIVVSACFAVVIFLAIILIYIFVCKKNIKYKIKSNNKNKNNSNEINNNKINNNKSNNNINKKNGKDIIAKIPKLNLNTERKNMNSIDNIETVNIENNDLNINNNKIDNQNNNVLTISKKQKKNKYH